VDLVPAEDRELMDIGEFIGEFIKSSVASLAFGRVVVASTISSSEAGGDKEGEEDEDDAEDDELRTIGSNLFVGFVNDKSSKANLSSAEDGRAEIARATLVATSPDIDDVDRIPGDLGGFRISSFSLSAKSAVFTPRMGGGKIMSSNEVDESVKTSCWYGNGMTAVTGRCEIGNEDVVGLIAGEAGVLSGGDDRGAKRLDDEEEEDNLMSLAGFGRRADGGRRWD